MTISAHLLEAGPASPPAHVPGRNTTLALLALVMAGAFFGRMSLNALQGPVQAGLRLDDDQIALVLGMAMAAPAILGGIPAGLLADRLNRARLLSFFCLLNLVGTIATALSIGLWTLFASRALVGFSTAAISITVPSLLSDLFPRSQRGKGSVIYGVSQIIGMSAAFAAGGALAIILPGAQSWRTGMLAMCGPPLLIMLLSFAFLREQPRSEVTVKRPSPATSVAELWRYKRIFLPLLVGLATIGVADGATLVWVVPTLSRNFGVSAGYANSLMSVALLVGGLLGPVMGGLAADRCLATGGPARAMTLLIILAAASAALGLFALGASAMLAGLSLTAFLVTGSMIVAVSLTLITVLFPNELRGFCTSVVSTTQILCSFGVAPSLVSAVAAARGGPAHIGVALAIVCVSASVACAATFLVGRRYVDRRPVQVEATPTHVAAY